MAERDAYHKGPLGAPARSADAPAAERTPLRPGTATLALALVTLVAVGGAISALVNYDLVGLGHLPRCAIFVVFVLLAANALIHRLTRRRALSTAQLAFVYIAVLVMAGIPGQQLVTYLYLGMIGSQYHAAGQGNEYASEVMPYVKSWMVPSMDAESPTISWAFHGLPDGAAIPWGDWVRPIVAWTPLVLALLGLQILIAALLRERWDQERLTYPLAQVPVELVTYRSERSSVPELLRSRLFWGMFLIPAIVHTRNAMSFHNPDITPINLNSNLGAIFGTPPWTNLDYLPIMVYFETIGATFLIPADTGFSLWFFWIFRRFVYIYRDLRGLLDHEAYMTNQGIGAYVFLTLVCLWGARHTLVRAVRGLGRRERRTAEEREAEPVHPSVALAGIALCVAVIVVWGRAAGASTGLVLTMLAVYLAGLIVLSRVVAESGLFCVWTPMGAPQEVVIRAWGGATGPSPQCVTALCYMGWKIQDTASATMANVLQGFKVAELARLRGSGGLWLMVTALVVAVFASHAPSIHAIYTNGVYDLGWWPRGASESIPLSVHNLTKGRVPLGAEGWTAMVHGVIAVGVLQLIRLKWHQFPLQAFPFAATLGPQWMMDRYGFSIFLGWIVKSLILKYGNVSLYNKLRPAAFGIICGNAFILLFWTICHYFSPISGVLVIE